MEINGLQVELRPMVFIDQMMPAGFLTKDDACHALWYFYILAENARKVVGRGPEDQTIEYNAESGEAPALWMDKRYNAQIKSVAILYGVPIEMMQNFWPNIRMEARRLNMPEPKDEYVNLTGHDRIT